MTDSRPSPSGLSGRASARAGLFVLLTAAFLAAFVTVDQVFVHTVRGQKIDNAGLAGSVIGRARIINEVDRILNLVSVTALVATVIVVALIGFSRRRPGLALLSILILAGSNISTQVLKTRLLMRPDLGVDQTAGFARNTLPSGHTTVGLSVAVALLFVTPPRLRPAVAVCGALGATALGIATLSAGWHRPSDAIAAYLIVGACSTAFAAVAVLFVSSARGGATGPLFSSALLLLVGAGGLVLGAVALGRVGAVPAATGRRHLFLAYAGGSIAVAGTAFATMGLLVWVAHALDPATIRNNAPRRRVELR